MVAELGLIARSGLVCYLCEHKQRPRATCSRRYNGNNNLNWQLRHWKQRCLRVRSLVRLPARLLEPRLANHKVDWPTMGA